MPISNTTPAAIRVAVKDAVLSINVDHVEDSADKWIYTEDEFPTGKRNFTIINSDHAWFTGTDATHGGRGTSYSFLMAIRVGYGGLPRAAGEDMSMSDHGSLWELLHPRTASGAGNIAIDGVMSFMADGTEPLMEPVITFEGGGPVFDFVFFVHYLRAHQA